MPSNFPWLKIKGMKIDSKKRQQNKCPDNFETVLRCPDYQANFPKALTKVASEV